MTIHSLNHKKPVVYGLIGFVTGAIAASLIAYTLRTVPSTPVSLTTELNSRTAKLINSPQASPTNVPEVRPGMPGMMAHSDQHFIVMMIPHHEAAVAMAELAITRSKHPEIKKLAEAIETTQTQEIQQMQTWYKQWYGTNVPIWSPGMGFGMGQRNRTSLMPQRSGRGDRGYEGRRWMGIDLDALKNASDFDQEFILQMIPHHQMAIMMSSMVANSATHPEIRTLAQSIIRNQSAEIEQMQQWERIWYPQKDD